MEKHVGVDGTMDEAGISKESGYLEKVRGRVEAWVWTPAEELPAKSLRRLQAVVRIFLILAKEFQKDAILLRSSALTYAVVLSMVPMLALGTAVLKGLGAGDQMREAAYRLIDQFDTSGAAQKQTPTAIMPPTGVAPLGGAETSNKSEAKKTGTAQEDLVTHLRTAVDTVFDYVDRTNFATLGAFGILGLVLAVISVLGRIENAMNVIWESESERPFGRKVLDYLALMILLPVAVNVGLAASATMSSPALLSLIHKLVPVDWVVSLLLKLVPVAILVATFAILYRFLPNVRVRVIPALIGGCLGGVGWLVVQAFYVKLQIGVAKYNAIYGSFATLPLFLIWIYVGWVVFLTGAEMAFAVQRRRGYLPGCASMTPKVRVALAFDILALVMKDFGTRKISCLEALAQRLAKPEAQVGRMLEELARAGFLRRLDEGEGCYMPSAPAERIYSSEIIDAICGKESPASLGGKVAEEVFGSIRATLDKRTLASELQRQRGSA